MARKTGLFLGLCLSVSVVLGQEKEMKFAFDNYHRYSSEAKACTDPAKKEAMVKLRTYFHRNPYRLDKVDMPLPPQKCLELLTERGTFSDMEATEREFEQKGTYQKGFRTTAEDRVGIFISQAFDRICCIADGYRRKELKMEGGVLPEKLLKAVVHYGMLEIRRPNSSSRFHASCFAIPTAAMNTYFACLEQMDEAERGNADNLLTAACDMLKVIGLQAYTQPLRCDETDKNVVSIERFRNHVWWVGGNALAYRSLLPIAAMYNSVPMVDLLAEVCRNGISVTSQWSNEQSFWTEGFTADGAGWGHGKQCLVWGYPIDGTFNALKILSILQGTPWTQNLDKNNSEAILNFLRGGNWYYYKGFTLPCLDRGSYAYYTDERPIPYEDLLNRVLTDWIDAFTEEEQQELKQLHREVKTHRINMQGHEQGIYSGTRWFFNNDDLIKKTPDCHIIVNMASVRCDGLESATNFADAYNFYPTDGMTLLQRDGKEYRPIMGGWDMTASPGVTAREGLERLKPVVNWRGYCSKHNYAAAATDGSGDAVAGYIFEKMNASEKEGVNDRGSRNSHNEVLYGIKAYKSYFLLGDYMVALGAGVTNKQPWQPGHIRTTIDQTALLHPVYFLDKGKKSLLPKGVQSWNVKKKNAAWLIQEGKFAYQILPEYSSSAFVTCETKATDWIGRNKANETKRNLPDSVNILRIWVDHGKAPIDATYGYTVYTGKGTPPERLPFHVLRNDTLVQAVQSDDKHLLQAVFYPGNKGVKVDGNLLTVSAPCTLMIKEMNGKSLWTATDACMNPEVKEIVVSYRSKEIRIPMPQKERLSAAGSVVETGRDK